MSDEQVTVELVQQEDYRFDIQFGGAIPHLIADEPAPLGTGVGPSPVQLLCASSIARPVAALRWPRAPCRTWDICRCSRLPVASTPGWPLASPWSSP